MATIQTFNNGEQLSSVRSKINTSFTNLNTDKAEKPPTYTISNDSTLRTLDASNITINDLANILATLIKDLKS